MERLLLCERHATATGFEVGPMHPLPPVGLVCPLCIAAHHDAPPEHTGTSTEFGIVGLSARATDEAKLGVAGATAHEAWKAKQRAAGQVLPGSPEESEALAQMDDERVTTIARDHGVRNARVVTSRYVDGVLTDFVKVKGRRGLIPVQA